MIIDFLGVEALMKRFLILAQADHLSRLNIVGEDRLAVLTEKE